MHNTKWGANSSRNPILRTGGIAGLFRGIVPGSTRSLLANGCSMVVFTQCQNLRQYFFEKKELEADLPHAPIDENGNAILEGAPSASATEQQ